MDTKTVLKEAGISPSIQRIKVYEYIDTYRNHPTIDEIYQNLSPELPTLSKTTVYNVINLLMEKGLIKGVLSDESTTHYEVTHTLHSHFKCTVCGTLYDIPYQNVTRQDLGEDFQIIEVEVIYSGICSKCNQI